MGILPRVLAKAFANWIHPDISGDACGIVSRPEDVVVEFLLPERFPKLLSIFARGCLFQVLDKREQAARRIEAGDKGVKMIGHHAIGVDREAMCDGLFEQNLDQPRGICRVCEHRTPACAAQRNEVRSWAYVPEPLNADVLVRERHSRCLTEATVHRNAPGFVAAASIFRRAPLFSNRVSSGRLDFQAGVLLLLHRNARDAKEKRPPGLQGGRYKIIARRPPAAGICPVAAASVFRRAGL